MCYMWISCENGILIHDFTLKFSQMNLTWKHLCKLDTIKLYHMHLPCNLLLTWNFLTWNANSFDMNFACESCEIHVRQNCLCRPTIHATEEITTLGGPNIIIYRYKYFDIIWGTYVSPDVLTWLTRGVSKSADCFPRHLIANRIQRQHLSVIRTSPWYLSHARDSTGQTCCKTQYRRTERAMDQIYAKKKNSTCKIHQQAVSEYEFIWEDACIW